jgi:hypothetical protein
MLAAKLRRSNIDGSVGPIEEVARLVAEAILPREPTTIRREEQWIAKSPAVLTH